MSVPSASHDLIGSMALSANSRPLSFHQLGRCSPSFLLLSPSDNSTELSQRAIEDASGRTPGRGQVAAVNFRKESELCSKERARESESVGEIFG